MVSARMKPRSKSEWISPAAWGALAPLWTVQARASFGPTVKKVIRREQVVARADHAGEAGFVEAQSPRGIPCARRRPCRPARLSIAAETITALAPSALAFSNTRAEKALPLGGRGFLDIADVEHRLGGQQLRLREDARLFLVLGH